MNKNKSKLISLVIVVLTLGLSLSLHFSLADWQSPATNPPNDNAPTPINIGPGTQTKAGALILNTWGNSQGLIVDKGNSGIGTIYPYAKLDVMGGVKVGEDSICNVGKEGTIRYNPSEPSIDYCNGTDWVEVELKCVPNCPPTNGCGDDGCGGSCGTCPSPSNGAAYCSGNNVYQNVTSYSCNSSHTCVAVVTPTLVQSCTVSCSGGVCIGETCTYTYTEGKCNACTNQIPLTVASASPVGCTGTPLTSKPAADACGGATTLSYGGHIYPLKSICGRCWFAENLQLNIGSNVCHPSGCGSPWGRLYTWYTAVGGVAAANTCGAKIQGICPAGWHIPSGIMWQIPDVNGVLLMCYEDDVNKLVLGANATCVKSTSYWNSPGTNTSGFDMPAPGIYTSSQGFMGRLTNASMWASGMGWYDHATEHRSQLYLNSTNLEVYGSNGPDTYMSVRCVKN